MTYVAVCALIVAAVTVFSCAGLLRSLVRQHGRREDLLIAQIMHLTGKTWTPPPANSEPAADSEPRQWTPSPEQLPIN